MSLHTDGKGPQLMVTYAAANASLEVRHGVLGHVKHPHLGKGHIGICLGVKEVVRNFCTEGFFAPDVSKLERRINATLTSHIRRIAFGLDADAASDEQLAARVLQRKWMPNSIVFRDHTHAARRLLTRP